MVCMHTFFAPFGHSWAPGKILCLVTQSLINYVLFIQAFSLNVIQFLYKIPRVGWVGVVQLHGGQAVLKSTDFT